MKAENNYSPFKEKKLRVTLIWFFSSLEELLSPCFAGEGRLLLLIYQPCFCHHTFAMLPPPFPMLYKGPKDKSMELFRADPVISSPPRPTAGDVALNKVPKHTHSSLQVPPSILDVGYPPYQLGKSRGSPFLNFVAIHHEGRTSQPRGKCSDFWWLIT